MPVAAVSAASYDRAVIREALCKAFGLLGLNADNPFAGMVTPGQTVFIKPNWVAHRYRASCNMQHDVFTTITHPQVIREVALLADRALQGRGRILIGDNPSIDANFAELLKVQGLDDLHTEMGAELALLDLRPLVCADLADYGCKGRMTRQPGDPLGETVINLGKESLLYGMNPKLFRGVFNEREETVRAHTRETQLYSFSNSIYTADLFISIPKLKTHHKVGTTLNLKGLVGTMGTKNYLVHWREGFPAIGGDAYPDFRSWLADLFRKVKKRGAWSGNDTIWRMVADLHTGISRGPKRFFSVVDGILGGEGDGPFCPEPNHSRVLIAGTDFLETDIVASRLMGFRVEAIRYLAHYIASGRIDPRQIHFSSDFMDAASLFDASAAHLNYKPPTHWQDFSIGRMA
jgi:uncharacterized protein (DUF362 family)